MTANIAHKSHLVGYRELDCCIHCWFNISALLPLYFLICCCTKALETLHSPQWPRSRSPALTTITIGCGTIWIALGVASCSCRRRWRLCRRGLARLDLLAASFARQEPLSVEAPSRRRQRRGDSPPRCRRLETVESGQLQLAQVRTGRGVTRLWANSSP